MDPELSDADMEALNKLAEDFEKLNQQWKMRDESRRIEAANKAASMDKKFDRIIALFEKMMPTPTSESERELCVPVETDMVSKGTVVNAVEVDEDSSEPELDSKAAEFYFGEVKVDAMVESVGSASAEIDLASIDVTDKSDSAIATGVFEDGDLDVSTIDSTQTEVTSDLFSADFSSVFVSSDAIIGEWSFETKFCVSNTISDLCLLRVCGNASGNFPLFCAAHRALSDDWYPIQLFHKAFVCLNPPWKPPDSRTHIEFLKLMSLPTPSNYDTEIVINKEDLCIVLKETEAKKGVAITLESMLKIDKLDDYVAELEKGVYGLFESFARLYLLNSSVGQTAGKVGDQLLSTDAEWETARQITNFTKYLNEDKLDKMWQGLFLTSLRVHMIYSSSEAGLVWSTLLKIKFYDHNRIAGKAACHKLSLNVRFGKPPAKPPDDVVLRDVSCCETSNVSHSLSSHLVSCGCHIWYCSEYWDLGLPLIQRQELLVWTTIRICASIFMMVIEDSPDSYRICCLSSSLISLWLSILRYKRCFSWFYKWRMVDGYCALPELKKFMETMIVEANLKMIGQTRVGSYFAHSVVEKVSGTTKYNREDSYLYVILHPVDYQAVWVFNMDKLDDLHEEQWFKSPSCALSRKLNFCISDAGDSVYQTSFSFSDMLWDLVDHPSTLRHCNDGLILLVWVEKPPPLPPELERGYRGCSGQTSMISNHALYARPPAKPPHDSSKLLLLKEQTLTKKVATNVVMRVIELDKCHSYFLWVNMVSYFLWVNMISLLSKDGLVRIQMRNLKLDVNSGKATPVDGGKDDLIRALGCGYSNCNLGPSQENDIDVLKNYTAADLRAGINCIPKEFLLDPRYAAPEQYIMSTQTPSAPSAPVATELSPVLWQMNLPDRFDIKCGDVIYRSTLPRSNEITLTAPGVVLALGALSYLWATPGVAPGFFDMFVLAFVERIFRPTYKKDDFVLGKKLGEGAFGAVYRATSVKPNSKKEGDLVLKKASEFGAVEIWMNERVRRACANSCADFLYGFLDTSSKNGSQYWLLWRFEGEDTLADLMQSKEFPYNVKTMILGEVQDLPKGIERENKIIQTIMRQLLFALDGLHSTGIVHRDIKPQNIIFSEGTRTFKIIDLGAAADLRVGINYIPKEFLLDPRYAAPEQYIMSTQTPSAPSAPVATALSPVLWQMNLPDRFDIYSVGLIFLQMAFPSLRSDNNLIQFNRQLKKCNYDLVAWRRSVEPRAGSELRKGFDLLDLDGGIGWELLTSMIRFKARKRTSAKGALAHPYFDREGLLALSSMQNLRLQLFRATQQDYGEAAKWIIRLMAKSGTEQDGGFTELQLQELIDKRPTKKANAQRNALASALKIQRKILKSVNETVDEIVKTQKSLWWNKWIPKQE